MSEQDKDKKPDQDKPQTLDNTWVEEITPASAMAYLKKNRNNRPISRPTVDRFAQLMLASQWLITHQGLAFDTEGFLLDGQHRLCAIVKSGCTVSMRVTVDLPIEAMTAIDTGHKRTQGQILHMRGQKYASTWAATLNAVQRLLFNSNRVPLSVMDLEQALKEEEDLLEAFEQHWVPSHMRVSWLSAAFFFALRKNPEKILAFMKAYDSGIDLQEGDPVHSLRRLFVENRTARAYTPREKSLRVLTALRAYLRGEKISYSHIYAVESSIDFFITPHITRPNASAHVLGRMCLARIKESQEVQEPEKDAKAASPEVQPKKTRLKKGQVR